MHRPGTAKQQSNPPCPSVALQQQKQKGLAEFGLGVINADKHGKEVTYSTTERGREYLARYTEIRERRLIDALVTLGLQPCALGELAQYLRKMSGLYDQAARAAASL